ncbi:hypothetical protein HK101_005630 [Irineochytrium annulatum]|nr:hypothetical protein HK101_005630 [Irineochytrium annulatum]
MYERATSPPYCPSGLPLEEIKPYAGPDLSIPPSSPTQAEIDPAMALQELLKLTASWNREKVEARRERHDVYGRPDRTTSKRNATTGSNSSTTITVNELGQAMLKLTVEESEFFIALGKLWPDLPGFGRDGFADKVHRLGRELRKFHITA